jgi:hypothetical protein
MLVRSLFSALLSFLLLALSFQQEGQEREYDGEESGGRGGDGGDCDDCDCACDDEGDVRCSDKGMMDGDDDDDQRTSAKTITNH